MLQELSPKDAGRRIRRLRRHLDWTQERLAQELGHGDNQNLVPKLEKGERKYVDYNVLVAVATVTAGPLGLDRDDVLDYLTGKRPLQPQMSYYISIPDTLAA